MPLPYRHYGGYIRPYFRKEPEKSYTVIGLSLLTVIIFGSFAVAPAVKTILEVHKEVALLKKAATILEQKISDIEMARAAYARAVKYEREVDSQLHVFRGWSDELEKLYQGAAANNVVVTEVMPRTSSMLNVKVRGDYRDVRKYLVDLEEDNIAYAVESLKIGQMEGDTSGSLTQSNSEVYGILTITVTFLGE